MDITQFAKMFPQKMAEVRKYVEGEGVKIDMGRIALDHFDVNFEKGGFVDSVLNPWKEVARRKPDSPWFGHSGQTGKRSPERMNAPILHGETRELRRATRMEILSNGVRIINSTPMQQCISLEVRLRSMARSLSPCTSVLLSVVPRH